MTETSLEEDFLRLVTAESATLQDIPGIDITTIRKIFEFEQKRYPVRLERTLVLEVNCLLGKKTELVHIFLSADNQFYQLVHPLHAYNCVYVRKYSYSRLFFFALHSISVNNIKSALRMSGGQLSNLIAGGVNEGHFFQMIMKPLYVKHPFIKMVNEASLNNDIHGADYQITVRKDGHQYVIPLQLKSSRGYQQEHKKKFPRIPSIVWNTESSFDLTEKKVIDIIYAYIMYKETNNIHYILHETAIVT